MQEKLALLKIAFCSAVVVNEAASPRISIVGSSVVLVVSAGVDLIFLFGNVPIYVESIKPSGAPDDFI